MMSLYRTMVLIAAGAVLAGCAATAPQPPVAAEPESSGMAGVAPGDAGKVVVEVEGVAHQGSDDTIEEVKKWAQNDAYDKAIKKAFGVVVYEYKETDSGLLVKDTKTQKTVGKFTSIDPIYDYLCKDRDRSYCYRIRAKASRLSGDVSRPPETGAPPSAASSGSAASNASAPASRAREGSGVDAAPLTTQHLNCISQELEERLVEAVECYAGILEAAPGDKRALQNLERFYGRTFRDCDVCPLMVVVPPGSFTMGSPEEEGGRLVNEGPLREVTIEYPFAVGVSEVMKVEWEQCYQEQKKACPVEGLDYEYRRIDDMKVRYEINRNHPMTRVNWVDAAGYVRWLKKVTEGKKYRLLNESEWEYVARAGTDTLFSWGDNGIGRDHANCNDCGSRWDGDGTAPVKAFKPNNFGLYDVHGNVWEWVQDCWNDSYHGAPVDGRAWTSSGDAIKCGDGVIRGGGWKSEPAKFRSASRQRGSVNTRYIDVGFRVARTLTP